MFYHFNEFSVIIQLLDDFVETWNDACQAAVFFYDGVEGFLLTLELGDSCDDVLLSLEHLIQSFFERILDGEGDWVVFLVGFLLLVVVINQIFRL